MKCCNLVLVNVSNKKSVKFLKKMPVTTRSQSRKISEKVGKSVVKKEIMSYRRKVRPDPTNLFPWFSSVIAESIETIKLKENESLFLKSKVSRMSSFLPQHREEVLVKAREIYFDNIRRATEVMYFVSEYLPIIYGQNQSQGIETFIVTVYNKIHEMYNQLRMEPSPISDWELKTVSAAIDVLEETEMIIIRLLPHGTEIPRRRKYVHIAAVDKYIPSVEF